MGAKTRKIEVDSDTADLLETQAASRGISVSELVAALAGAAGAWPTALETMRSRGEGPWHPGFLVEDAHRLAEFRRTGEAIPWEEVSTWMRSWSTPDELPPPKPRKL